MGEGKAKRLNALEYLLRDGAGEAQYLHLDPFLHECVRPVHPKEKVHWALWNQRPANAFDHASVCKGTLGKKAAQESGLLPSTRSDLYTAPSVHLQELHASNRDLGQAQEKALLRALESGVQLFPEQIEILKSRGHKIDDEADQKPPELEMPVLQHSKAMTLQDLDFGMDAADNMVLDEINVADKPSEGVYSKKPHSRFPMVTCEQYHQIGRRVHHKHVIMPGHEAHVARLLKENPDELGCNNNTLVKETLRYVVDKSGPLRNEEENQFLARFLQTKLPFKKLDDSTLMQHVGPVTLQWFKAGQVVYLEGQPFSGVYYLLQGKLVNYSPDVRSGGVLRAFLQGQIAGADEGSDMRQRDLSCRAAEDTMTIFVPEQSWCPLWDALQQVNNVSQMESQKESLRLTLRHIVGERHLQRLCQVAKEQIYTRGTLISSRLQLMEGRQKLGISEHQCEGDDPPSDDPEPSFTSDSNGHRGSAMSVRRSRLSIQSTRSSIRQSQDLSSKLRSLQEYVKVIVSGEASIVQKGSEIGIVSAGAILNFECLCDEPQKYCNDAFDEVLAASVSVVCLEIPRDEFHWLGYDKVEQILAKCQFQSTRWECWADLRLSHQSVRDAVSASDHPEDAEAAEAAERERRERLIIDRAYIERRYWPSVAPLATQSSVPPEFRAYASVDSALPDSDNEEYVLFYPKEHEHMPVARLQALRAEAGLPPRILTQEESTSENGPEGDPEKLARKLQVLTRTLEESKRQEKKRQSLQAAKDAKLKMIKQMGITDSTASQNDCFNDLAVPSEDAKPADKYTYSIRPNLDRSSDAQVQIKRNDIQMLEQTRRQHMERCYERDVDISTGQDTWEEKENEDRQMLLSYGAIFPTLSFEPEEAELAKRSPTKKMWRAWEDMAGHHASDSPLIQRHKKADAAQVLQNLDCKPCPLSVEPSAMWSRDRCSSPGVSMMNKSIEPLKKHPDSTWHASSRLSTTYGSKWSTTLASGPSDDLMESFDGVLRGDDSLGMSKTVCPKPPSRPQSRAEGFRAEPPRMVAQGRLSPAGRPVGFSERTLLSEAALSKSAKRSNTFQGRKVRGRACLRVQPTEATHQVDLLVTPSRR
eukprot:gnl/MRDRNA2_/MRDRNA2_51134_c0_seq1.p1 gnl/MRDRNA2_/MRDRNA2_51134_c0~~gnl/MRDRNA2_/MRDRNA2_51134_c0_seq1.p1  ORF type:complete len:1097 (-),score=210.54 gnl/MRDRNA2_/MRDRNA2_51134_c0_seq1:20-3310(-)